MRGLELPSRKSPCIKLFIKSLLDELDHNRCASSVSESGVSTPEESVHNHESEIRPQLVSPSASALSLADIPGDSLCALARALTSNSNKNRCIHVTPSQAKRPPARAQ